MGMRIMERMEGIEKGGDGGKTGEKERGKEKGPRDLKMSFLEFSSLESKMV